MAQKPNYISERQRYIPNVMDTSNVSTTGNLYDYDTRLSEVLSKYSVLYKWENIESTPLEKLEFTRRGKKFYDKVREAFPNDVDAAYSKLRVLIINQFRGHRMAYHHDETEEILVFDNNGFLAANPPLNKAFVMTIDDTLYIAFKHERYDENEDDDRDTTGRKAKTSSTIFNVVGVVINKPSFVPAAALEFLDSSDPASSDYQWENSSVTAATTRKIPASIGISFIDPPVSQGGARIQRWANDPEGNYGLFVSLDLEAYASYLETLAPSSIPGLVTSNISSSQLANCVEEVIQIIRNRAEFVFFATVDRSKYEIEKQTSNEFYFRFVSGISAVQDLDLYLIKDYCPFRADDPSARISIKIVDFLKGTQFYGQNRSKPFVCHLSIKRNHEFDYELSSPCDQDYVDGIKALKLFNTENGLHAIPLISYDKAYFDVEDAPLVSKGAPHVNLKAPDVMLWIDGVKMVPYIDYLIEESNENDVCACQFIKLMRLPGTAAASTDPNTNDEDEDDAMFPLPLEDNGSYDITVIAAWPRGDFPSDDGTFQPEEEVGLLDRYIGPTVDVENSYGQVHPSIYPVYAANRSGYPGGDFPTNVLLNNLRGASSTKVSAGFDYKHWRIIPVGALSETGILAFQAGRYIPTTGYSRRVAGDRVFVFNSEFQNLQDMELHFFVDLRINELRSAIEDLSGEEGTFDFIVKTVGRFEDTDKYFSNFKTLVDSITKWTTWPSASSKPASDDFYGFFRWINTATLSQRGTLHSYLLHHGYGTEQDVFFDANVDLSNRIYRSINVDPSNPTITGEVTDVPNNKN